MPTESPVAAVLTSYRPDADVLARFEHLLALCGWVIVVDNTPGGHEFGELPECFVLLQDGVNKGLGLALNAGVNEARRRGAHDVFLFDQDSTPNLDVLRGLLNARNTLRSELGERICVAPRFVDDSRIGAATTQVTHRPPLQPMTCLPTSGMLLPVVPFCESGGFAHDLFLDLVDFEWCWRVRDLGWQFFRVNEVPMFHRLGLAQRRFFKLQFHVPAPFRHYFQFRDTLRLAMRSYVPAYSKFRLLGVLPLKFLVYPWLLDRGAERLKWMTLGITDALRGRQGAGAAAAKLGA